MYDNQNNDYRTDNGDGSYRYVYRRSDEPAYPQELKPVKKKAVLPWGKLIALMLVCALVGGLVGAGVIGIVSGGGGRAELAVSDRTVQEVELVKVDGKTKMSMEEVYAANVNSVVAINVSGVSTNVFGYATETASAGSGFIVTEDGYIVTNYHVIKNARDVQVTLYSGETYKAEIIGGEEDYDLAVLKINAAGLKAVTLGDSDALNVGAEVAAIGNPLGELTFSMSRGVVSCVNRAINVDGTPFNMIQIDASINPGNSGGPLVNGYGEVIGIVSAKYTQYASTTVEGLGFAIPMNDVIAMVQDIMENGYVTNKAYMGLTPYTVTAEQAEMYSGIMCEGVYVKSVEEGGAAAKAGIREGDIIIKLGSDEIKSVADITAAKKNYRAGDTAEVVVYRSGEEVTLSITFDVQPEDTITEEPEQEVPQQQQPGNYYGNGNYGFGFTNPWDIFNYFYG
ncbi:MAG: trypsin-like peptidase domain-containing protein [Oscillospiraceae bacterium]|nr:trypsin-like peptidase domain-containing protein [Oscillospiraceae bacterium]